MVVFMKWLDKFSVNIREIDEQHKRLVEMINKLYAGMTSGEGSVAIGKTLSEMMEYAATHFATEEKYMIKYAYPEYARHKALHVAFVAKAEALRDQHKRDPKVLSTETGEFLRNWLREHILGVDSQYGPYLNEKGLY